MTPRPFSQVIERRDPHSLTADQWAQLFTPADHARAVRVLLAAVRPACIETKLSIVEKESLNHVEVE